MSTVRYKVGRLCLLAATSWALFPSLGAASGDGQRPFTVVDTIEWTKLVSFDARARSSNAWATFSPDGSQFLIHTRQGDVSRNVNVERLFVYQTSSVSDYLSPDSSRSIPDGKLVAERVVDHDSGHMRSVVWLNDREIAFIAEGDHHAPQLYIADVTGGSPRQLTQSETGIASFAVSGDRIVFYAHRKPTRVLAQAVGDQIIHSLINPPTPTSEPLELFELSRSSGVARRIDWPALRISLQYQRLWLSPSGRYAVALTPATDAPAHWSEYRAAAEELRFTPERMLTDPESIAALVSGKVRYLLIDLHRHAARYLLDAPSGSISGNSTPMEVFWPADERSVIVSSTYLPLGEGRRQYPRSLEGPAIAEIELESGAATLIAWEPPAHERSSRQPIPNKIQSLAWDPVRQTLEVESATASGAVSLRRFRKGRRGWSQVSSSSTAPRIAPALQLDVRQSLNERPKLYVSDASGAKLLLDPNPAADQFAFGNVEAIKWVDHNNITWTGGLVYPTGYVPGQRYPLVLQTHGFRDGRFLLDGPAEQATTAFAAQALANAGFVVLQAAENVHVITNDEREAALVAEGWRAAIEDLVGRGLVDPEKVGLVAFSRTCMHAIRFLADYPDKLAAVTLADGPWWGYTQRLFLTNYPSDDVAQIEAVTGGKLEIDKLAQWVTRDPLYKLVDARAAVRIEAMDPGALVALWETYAVLHASGRPVDLMYFPEGSHNVMKPAERLGSQGGSVDWFRFWLKGEEDLVPDKHQQYTRWRQLRTQTANVAARSTALR